MSTHENSGYIGVDKRDAKAGIYGLRKHYLERLGGKFAVPVPSSELWTPSAVTTLLWLDASDTSIDNILQSGGSVSQWSDKSGNEYHALQDTGSRQPTTNATTLNSLNVIDFTDPGAVTDGKKLKSSNPDPGDFRDVYLVARWTGLDWDNPCPSASLNYPGLFNGLSGGNRGFIGNACFAGQYGGWWNEFFTNGASTTGYPNPQVTSCLSPFLVSFSAISEVTSDGYQVGSSGVYITSRTWIGYVAEVVCFSTKLASADKEIMEGLSCLQVGNTGESARGSSL